MTPTATVPPVVIPPRTLYLVTYGTQAVIVSATSDERAVTELVARIRHATHLVFAPGEFIIRPATDAELDRLDPKDSKGRRTNHVSAP